MRVDVLGIQFDNITMEEAVATGVSLAQGEGFHYVVTPNPEIVNLGRAMPDYGDILNGADLVLPDGIGILYAGKILKTPLKERVPGIDFATGLLEKLAGTSVKLYLLGAKPGVAEQAAQKLLETYPGLSICGWRDGYFTDSQEVAAEIRECGAQLVFVCLGAPKQERFIVEYGPQTGARLMLGLGGALDVFSGQVRRAPAGFQKLGLEWFYRLLCQPSRIGRMAKLPLFLGSVMKSRGRRGSQ